MPSFPLGFVTGLALITPIGAQNAFVVRQGLSRAYVATVATLCVLIDATLIGISVAGVGAFVEARTWVGRVLRVLGSLFLLGYGLRSLWLAARPASVTSAAHSVASWRACVTTTLAVSLLNPHVYLDTVVILGALSAQQGEVGKWWFAAGAGLASVAWFFSLGYTARACARWMNTPGTWRVIDAIVGVIMMGLAILLWVG